MNAREDGPRNFVRRLAAGSAVAALAACAAVAGAQSPAEATTAAPATATAPVAGPIAIVPINGPVASANPTVTGALEVTGGKAMIAASGSITAGDRTTTVILPHRGTLRVCATTTVKLAADTAAADGSTPGLLMALDHGALETSYATGQNADIILTPQFRILVGGPGASDLKVRLGDNGDTCVDNSGADAPYVVVTSLFEDGLYRVQPGQRVMFEHGSLHQVVDDEKEACGCPPAPVASADGNAFPLAQSEGLAPTAPIAPAPENPNPSSAAEAPPMVHNSAPPVAPAAEPAATSAPTTGNLGAPAEKPAPKKKKPGFFGRIGSFFKKIFGAD